MDRKEYNGHNLQMTTEGFALGRSASVTEGHR